MTTEFAENARTGCDAPSFPDAVEPERHSWFRSEELRLHIAEWGPADGPVLVLCHGFWDHVRSFATLAPRLAAAGYRVCAIDARGHGDSDWADTYFWWAWVTDIVRWVERLDREVCLVGHSFGGGQVVDAAVVVPDRVRKVVNIDGFGPPPEDEEAGSPVRRLRQFLDYRRKITARPDWRPSPDLAQLIARRGAQNPRLHGDWLRYFVYHGARQTESGWTWKSDPQMAVGAGPWKPEFVEHSYAALEVPLLAIEGSEADTWGPMDDAIVAPRLHRARDVTRVRIAGAGHFVHMEKPEETAAAILEFLA